MNCEHVEEQLSAYLDNMLAPEERREITIHLHACSRCMVSLAELRQNDILLAQLPRIGPRVALHERIFSSPEMLVLTSTTGSGLHPTDEWAQLLVPGPLSEQKTGPLPQLVSFPDGRSPQKQTVEPSLIPSAPILHSPSVRVSRRTKTFLTPLRVAVAVLILVTVGAASLFALSLSHSADTGATVLGAITPPAAGPGTGSGIPLAAGTRFVFLHDGALWSTLTGSNNRQPERLTPSSVDVDAGWIVSPTMPGHTAGDMLAYIDLRGATVHTIRSDGQQDTTLARPLLKKGTEPTSVWETVAGEAILSSLAWSKDGDTLAFVADPTNNGQTNLYLYSIGTGIVQQVDLSFKGGVSHPIWSPDSTRLAFEVTHDGLVSVLDYNIQNQEVLDLTNLAASQGSSTNSILSMGWASAINEPTVTWSLGRIGHISSLWIHHVGAGGTLYPQLLLRGSYVQALYSQNWNNGVGSWLVIAAVSGLAGDIWRIDLSQNANLVPLSRGRQVSLARWAPDGSSIFYMDQQTNGIGRGYIVNATTGASLFIASDIAASPTPVWSADKYQLAYSTGKGIRIVNIQDGGQAVQLPLQGLATSISWSPALPHQLVASLGDTAVGIYLVDTDQNTSQQLDHLGTDSQIQWTEIP
jgi:Tol biopolymer transport system component